MAKRKIAHVETAGDNRVASLKTEHNERLGDAPPITPDELRAILTSPPKWPAGEGPLEAPGGMGIYSDGKPIKDIPHLIEWLEDFRQLIADSPQPERLLTHVRGVLKAGYRWRRFFTQTGSIPDLSAVTIAETVESRLVELIDDLTNGLPLTPAKGKAPNEVPKPRNGKDGRPKIEGTKEKQNWETYNNWKRSKAMGMTAKKFCEKECEGFKVADLDRIVGWVRIRRLRNQLPDKP